jgi:hypothetical protein
MGVSGGEIPFAVRLVFTAVVNTGLVLLVLGAWRSGRARGEDPRTTGRVSALTGLAAAAWLAFGAWLALRGTLAAVHAMPPPFAVFMVCATAGTVALALSPFGTRLVRGVSIAGLVAFQGLRIPIEWVLHALYEQGVAPVQMTWSGWNFDVVSGATALIVAALWLRGAVGPRTIAAWNVLGLLLLVNIVTIAVLSMPLPFRRFWNEPSNTFVFHAPWVWLPAFLVQGALFGHVLVFRWLAASRESSATRQGTTRERIQRTASRS